MAECLCCAERASMRKDVICEPCRLIGYVRDLEYFFPGISISAIGFKEVYPGVQVGLDVPWDDE